MLIEVDLKRNSNSNSKCIKIWSKLHLLVFVFYNPSDHVCEKLLKCRWSSLHFNCSSWNCNWIEFEIIPFKSNSKCYWSHFKFNSNKFESCIFRYIIFSWSFFIYYLLYLELVWIFYEFPKFGIISGIFSVFFILFNSFLFIASWWRHGDVGGELTGGATMSVAGLT